ncbi:acyltransferase [Paraburkholderia madseniana]|uniref:acyltransferase family protein n=1 Tax=Paraburkholderia madseniana TaxID=2599607 RepID=UPI0038BDEDE6
MRTIGSAFLSSARDEENNFLLLRLLAASLVVYGHSFGMAAARCASCIDISAAWFHYRYSGELGVHIFFVISGFLVFASFDRSRDLSKFIRARALRIFPALLVCVLLMVLVVGPLMTTFPLREYFHSSRTFEYLWSNATLYRTIGDLPGVFTSNVTPNIVNGPLWTLPIESRFYLFVAAFGALGWSSARWTANACVFVLSLLAILLPDFAPMIGGDPTYHRLGAFFAAGALLYINRDAIPLDGRILGLLVLCAICSYQSSTFDFACGLVISYAVLWVAFARKIKVPRFVHDYSYGIYLYGWPVGQMIALSRPDFGPYALCASTLAISWILGAASWFLVEKPCLALKNKPRKKTMATNKVAQTL